MQLVTFAQSFVNFRPLRKRQDVTLGDGHALSAIGTDDIDVILELVLGNGESRHCKLHDVLYVPKLAYNLLSVAKATKMGKRVNFHSNHCQIVDQEDEIVAVGVKRGDLYYLSCRRINDQVHVNDAYCLNAESKEFIWHRRFGYLNERSLHTLASQKLVDDFDHNTCKRMPFCKSCVEGKLHRTPFPSASRKRAEVPLGLVHSGVCGPLNSKSLSGARYFLTFVDEKTRYTWVYFLKSKNEVISKFLEWKALVERMCDY